MNDKHDTSPTAQTLRRLAAERILVLDGAMGTMIQGHKLEKHHYHGERFCDHQCEQSGTIFGEKLSIVTAVSVT